MVPGVPLLRGNPAPGVPLLRGDLVPAIPPRGSGAAGGVGEVSRGLRLPPKYLRSLPPGKPRPASVLTNWRVPGETGEASYTPALQSLPGLSPLRVGADRASRCRSGRAASLWRLTGTAEGRHGATAELPAEPGTPVLQSALQHAA